MKQEIIDIEELAQDSHNFNKGNEQGQQLMERSFKELGAGRSILLDRNGNIIAGNKSQQAAIAAGIKKVRVIETTGDELVAVKRTDVDIDSAEGRKMAYLDNLTTQVNLTWDETELEAVQADVEGFEVADFGFDIADLPQVVMPTDKQGEGEPGEGQGESADARDDGEKHERQRDPESEIIVATVSLFGTTEDMMMTNTLTKEQADKLIALAKAEGADNLMKRIIDAL
jgi:ParB-like chromosome segregation protein Spo0J